MINRMTKWLLSVVLALAGSTIAAAAPDEWNKETRIEINEPMEIPGRVLTPGAYIFKLLDSESERNTVEIYSVDPAGRQKFVTTVVAIPAYAIDTPDRATIRLAECPVGAPPAIHKWFYPGDNYGWEFVYPKSERLMNAAVAPAPQPAPAPAAEPAIPDPPAEKLAPESAELPAALEETASEPVKVSVLLTEEAVSLQDSADRNLPDTAGHSITELVAGLAMLIFGIPAVLLGWRKAQA